MSLILFIETHIILQARVSEARIELSQVLIAHHAEEGLSIKGVELENRCVVPFVWFNVLF